MSARNKISVIQINVDRNGAAQDLLWQTIFENRIDIAIGQEPNIRRTSNLFRNKGLTTFIYTNPLIPATRQGQGNDFCSLEAEGVVITSVYFSPNGSREDFQRTLNSLEANIRSSHKEHIVAGDLNAKSVIFGSSVSNERGIMLEEWVDAMGMVVINQGETPTFANANGTSIIDITLATENVSRRIVNWRVDEDRESLSGHRYVFFDILRSPSSPTRTTDAQRKGWKITPEGLTKLRTHCEGSLQGTEPTPKNAPQISRLLHALCDRCLIPKRQHPRRRPVYWWTAEIAELRRKAQKLRRVQMRYRQNGRLDRYQMARTEYKTAKSSLRKAIKASKARCWQELCQQINDDVWGRGYEIAMSSLRRRGPPTLAEAEINRQFKQLFPTKPTIEWAREVYVATDIRQVVDEETLTAASKLKPGKAAGPDGIPPEAARVFIEGNVSFFTELANNCFKDGAFPDEWKNSRLVLIPKPAKSNVDPPKYRPICVLNALGKYLETLIKTRIEREITDKRILHDSQYGFRTGRSTVDALKKVMNIPNEIRKKAYKNRELCAMLAVDIENAFNSAGWPQMVNSVRSVGISPYLVAMIKSYLSNRKTLTADGKLRAISCGIPQGSVLGPTLWNIVYDSVIRSVNVSGVTPVAYADDLALVIVGKTEREVLSRATWAITKVDRSLKDLELKLEPTKTELLVLVGTRRFNNLSLQIEEVTIAPRESIKYMGVHIGRESKMTTHIAKICEKATVRANILARLMPNVSGPTAKKRRILANVVGSIILYAAPIWAKAVQIKRYETMLERVNRRIGLRVTAAYRTAPTTAVLVLAGIPPIRLRVEERSTVYAEGKDAKSKARDTLMRKWQEEWDLYDGWCKVFIRDIKRWLDIGVDETNYFVTQAMTGHGVFGSYLLRIGKAPNDDCWYCGKQDTPEHTIFLCERWSDARQTAEEKCGVSLTRTNIGDIMVRSRNEWEAVKNMLEGIMRRKGEDELKRQEERRRR